MTTLDMTPYLVGDEKVTYTLERRQVWRQVGWLGLANRGVFSLGDHEGCKTDPAGFQPLWILIENEPPILDESSDG